MELSGNALGALAVATASILLASKGLFAKTLYEYGLTHLDVAATRSILAVPGFLLIAYWQHLRRPRHAPLRVMRRDVLGAMLAGLLCYYFGALANFYALTLIQANVERALLFSYPAMIIVAQAIWLRKWPPSATLVALVFTSLGIVFVTGAIDTQLTTEQLEGVIWVLFCSATIAIYFLMSASLTQRLGAGNFTAIAMTTAGAAFFLHYQWRGEAHWLSMDRSVLMTMLGLVIFATILPLFLVAEGVQRMGAARGGLVSTIGPPATAVMAFFLLGETLTVAQLAGTLLIIASVSALEFRLRRKKSTS